MGNTKCTQKIIQLIRATLLRRTQYACRHTHTHTYPPLNYLPATSVQNKFYPIRLCFAITSHICKPPMLKKRKTKNNNKKKIPTHSISQTCLSILDPKCQPVCRRGKTIKREIVKIFKEMRKYMIPFKQKV